MQRVIVTVRRTDETRARDLELPSDVEAKRLAEMIARALHWESDWAGKTVNYQIQAEPLGRLLEPTESLENAGVSDGAWLVLRSGAQGLTTKLEAAEPAPRRSSKGPVERWRPLGIDLPSVSDEPSTAPDEHASDFKWKPLD